MANDDAVRNYLLALNNPDALKDDSKVEELEGKLNDTDDPIERVKIRAELDRARAVDPEQYEADFVGAVKQWAKDNNVTPDALRAEGVSDDVLGEAGLVDIRRTSKRSTRSRVSGEEVQDAIRSRGDKFTVSDIEDVTGASSGTVRKYVNSLVDEGVIKELGEDDSWEGRGRPPTVYAPA